MVAEFTGEKMLSRIHCNFGLISMVYACYSTRWLLNLLKNKCFLHSMHVIAQDVCWISFSEKTFFSHTLQLRVHHFSPLFFTLQLHLLYVSSLFSNILHNFIFMMFLFFTCSSLLYQLFLDKNRRLLPSENIKYYHSCSVSTVAASATCTVLPRRPRMRSFAARNLARAHGTVIP